LNVKSGKNTFSSLISRKEKRETEIINNVYNKFAFQINNEIKAYRKTKDPLTLANILDGVAESYFDQGHYDKAGLLTLEVMKIKADLYKTEDKSSQKEKLLTSDEYIFRLKGFFKTTQNTNAKLAGVNTLNELGYKEYLPLFKLLVDDKDWQVRDKAREIVYKDMDLDYLRPMMRSSKYFKEGMISVISECGTSKNVELLKPLLRDKDDHVRLSATIALGRIGKPENVELLLPIFKLKDNDLLGWDYTTKEAAATAIARIGTSKQVELLKPLLKYDDDKYEFSTECLVNTIRKIDKPQNVEILKPLLVSSKLSDRCYAAESIGKIGKPEHIELLKPLLKDSSTVEAAAEAIGKIGKPEHVELLKPLLKDSSTEEAAVEAIGKIGKSEHVELLTPLFNVENDELRKVVVEAFKKIEKPEHLKQLKELLKDKDPSVRYTATMIIGAKEDFEDIKILEPLLKDEDKRIKIHATNAIARIKMKKEGKLDNIERIKLLLKDEDGDRRVYALQLLGKTGKPQHVELLLPFIKTDDRLEREAAIGALAEIGKPEHVEYLKPLIEYRYRDSEEAVNAICMLGKPGQVALFEDYFDRPHLTGQYIERNCRSNAAEIISQIGSLEHITLLKSLLSDKDYGVERAAAVGLGNIATGSTIANFLLPYAKISLFDNIFGGNYIDTAPYAIAKIVAKGKLHFTEDLITP
jgi:HEAT repeat protein